MTNINEELAEKEFAVLRQWDFEELERIIKKYPSNGGLDGNQPRKDEYLKHKKLFFEKLAILRKKYGIPEPETK
ncbi:MAG: hypothetical protein WDA26_04810 [Pusillimonas sp.]